MLEPRTTSCCTSHDASVMELGLFGNNHLRGVAQDVCQEYLRFSSPFVAPRTTSKRSRPSFNSLCCRWSFSCLFYRSRFRKRRFIAKVFRPNQILITDVTHMAVYSGHWKRRIAHFEGGNRLHSACHLGVMWDGQVFEVDRDSRVATLRHKVGRSTIVLVPSVWCPLTGSRSWGTPPPVVFST